MTTDVGLLFNREMWFSDKNLHKVPVIIGRLQQSENKLWEMHKAYQVTEAYSKCGGFVWYCTASRVQDIADGLYFGID